MAIPFGERFAIGCASFLRSWGMVLVPRGGCAIGLGAVGRGAILLERFAIEGLF
jgi:hypothetical protein